MEKAAAAQLGRLLEETESSVSADFAAEDRRNCISGPWRTWRSFYDKYVAEPGHSEHESGLAVDLAQRGAPPDHTPVFSGSGVCRSFRKRRRGSDLFSG